MSIFDTRDVYKPFEYPEFEEIHNKLMAAYWHPGEVPLDKDIKDYQIELSEDEKELVKRILRNFVQSEIHVGCFWGDFIASYFKKPEIQNVARFISGNESVHSLAYDLLNASLGISEYHLLKADKKLYARVENLMDRKAKSHSDILNQVAKYSVFGEGIALFSSFLILYSFNKKNKLTNIGQIIKWSSVDESFHSEVGALIFNTIKKESPKLLTPEFKANILKECDKVVTIEKELIDAVFSGINVDIITKEEVINFVYQRANLQLKKIGFESVYQVDTSLLEKTAFFDILIFGESVNDFFANKETSYSRGVITFGDDTWD